MEGSFLHAIALILIELGLCFASHKTQILKSAFLVIGFLTMSSLVSQECQKMDSIHIVGNVETRSADFYTAKQPRIFAST